MDQDSTLITTISYLSRLELRLAHHSFDRTDPFHLLLVEAYNAMHKLSVETHYLSCDGGVGRPRLEKPMEERVFSPTTSAMGQKDKN